MYGEKTNDAAGWLVARVFIPALRMGLGAEAGRSLSSRVAWSTEQVPGQPGLHRETLSWGGGGGGKETKKEETNKHNSTKSARVLKRDKTDQQVKALAT